MRKLMFFFLFVGILATITFSYSVAVENDIDIQSLLITMCMFSSAFVVRSKLNSNRVSKQ